MLGWMIAAPPYGSSDWGGSDWMMWSCGIIYNSARFSSPFLRNLVSPKTSTVLRGFQSAQTPRPCPVMVATMSVSRKSSGAASVPVNPPKFHVATVISCIVSNIVFIFRWHFQFAFFVTSPWVLFSRLLYGDQGVPFSRRHQIVEGYSLCGKSGCIHCFLVHLETHMSFLVFSSSIGF